jgi:hypothetical protein
MEAAKSVDLPGKGKQPDHSAPFLPFFLIGAILLYTKGVYYSYIVENEIKIASILFRESFY